MEQFPNSLEASKAGQIVSDKLLKIDEMMLLSDGSIVK